MRNRVQAAGHSTHYCQAGTSETRSEVAGHLRTIVGVGPAPNDGNAGKGKHLDLPLHEYETRRVRHGAKQCWIGDVVQGKHLGTELASPIEHRDGILRCRRGQGTRDAARDPGHLCQFRKRDFQHLLD